LHDPDNGWMDKHLDSGKNITPLSDVTKLQMTWN